MSNPITKVCQHEKFNFKNLSLEPNLFDEADILPEFKNLVDNYLKRLLDCNIFDIVNYTHTEPFWREHRVEIINRERPEYPLNIHMNIKTFNKLLVRWECNE